MRAGPDVPMATAMAQPMVAQPMVAQPMVAQPMVMVAQPMVMMAPQPVVPMVTALGNQDGLPASPLVLGPPQPCTKTSGHVVDKLQSNFSTGSPAATYAYKAPTMDGTMTEAGFDRAVCMVDAEQGDPLASLLSEGRKVLDLAIDVEGRMSDMKKVLKHNCYATIGCLLNPFCTLCVLGEICAATHPMSCDGEGEGVEKLRVQANAHHLAITDRAVVYTRDAHVGVTTKNYIAFDQYGHRYPAVSQSESQVPAASLHVPLQHAELEVCAKKEIQPSSLNVTPWSDKCFDNTPDALVIVLRAGEGVRLVVACVEAGPASNAAAFVAEFARLKKNAPALSPELEAAYNSWFGQRLARSGTMAGAAPRANQTMDRGGVPGQAGNTTVKFVRSVGPLPPNLGILKSSMSHNSMLHFNVPKTGHIHGIRHGPYVGQLDADDRILSVNNVRVPGGNNPLTQQYLDQVRHRVAGIGLQPRSHHTRVTARPAHRPGAGGVAPGGWRLHAGVDGRATLPAEPHAHCGANAARRHHHHPVCSRPHAAAHFAARRRRGRIGPAQGRHRDAGRRRRCHAQHQRHDGAAAARPDTGGAGHGADGAADAPHAERPDERAAVGIIQRAQALERRAAEAFAGGAVSFDTAGVAGGCHMR